VAGPPVPLNEALPRQGVPKVCPSRRDSVQFNEVRKAGTPNKISARQREVTLRRAPESTLDLRIGVRIPVSQPSHSEMALQRAREAFTVAAAEHDSVFSAIAADSDSERCPTRFFLLFPKTSCNL
jgi:hypothetical protein